MAIKCRMGFHEFETFADGLKRKYRHCDREDWLMSKPYPKIGEPKYSWKKMWPYEF
jgi:hypothetical protein